MKLDEIEMEFPPASQMVAKASLSVVCAGCTEDLTEEVRVYVDDKGQVWRWRVRCARGDWYFQPCYQEYAGTIAGALGREQEPTGSGHYAQKWRLFDFSNGYPPGRSWTIGEAILCPECTRESVRARSAAHLIMEQVVRRRHLVANQAQSAFRDATWTQGRSQGTKWVRERAAAVAAGKVVPLEEQYRREMAAREAIRAAGGVLPPWELGSPATEVTVLAYVTYEWPSSAKPTHADDGKWPPDRARALTGGLTPRAWEGFVVNGVQLPYPGLLGDEADAWVEENKVVSRFVLPAEAEGLRALVKGAHGERPVRLLGRVVNEETASPRHWKDAEGFTGSDHEVLELVVVGSGAADRSLRAGAEEEVVLSALGMSPKALSPEEVTARSPGVGLQWPKGFEEESG